MTEERMPSLHLVQDDAPSATEARLSTLQEEILGLRVAMRTRGVIEQAKGMLMISHGITADEAFDVLARWSSLSNVKLVTVASTLVDLCSRTELAGSSPLDLQQAVLSSLA